MSPSERIADLHRDLVNQWRREGPEAVWYSIQSLSDSERIDLLMAHVGSDAT